MFIIEVVMEELRIDMDVAFVSADKTLSTWVLQKIELR